MHGIIRIIAAFLLTTVLLISGALPCSADPAEPVQQMQDTLNTLEIPADAEEALRDTGMDPGDPNAAAALAPDTFLQKLEQTALDELTAPLRLCHSLLALTVLNALLGSLGDTAAKSSVRRIFDLLCTVICISAAARPVCTCLTRTADTLTQAQGFMAGFVPVFAAFLAAGGSVAGSAAYQTFVLFLTENVMQLTNGILFPMLLAGTAAGIADAADPQLRLGHLVSGLRGAVTWILGTVMALFSALLSVRSFVASAADSLAAKSFRLLTSGMIPIVGSAVSEAYGTVQGSIQLLRNGTGALGILVIIWLTVPPLLSLLMYRLVFRIMQVFSDMAGAEPLSRLYRNMQSVLAAAFAMLVCSAVMLIVSGAVMLLLTGTA